MSRKKWMPKKLFLLSRYLWQMCWSSHQFWTFPKWDRFIASDNKWLACVFISITLLSLKPRDFLEFQKTVPPRRTWSTTCIKDHLHGGKIFISIKCIQTLLAFMERIFVFRHCLIPSDLCYLHYSFSSRQRKAIGDMQTFLGAADIWSEIETHT